MSACPTHGALLGGYVLGSLDPAEMEEMRVHVAGCPDCGPEAKALGALPALLDRIEPTDVPPPSLSPAIEEAVLDRFAQERRRARQPRRRWPRLTLPRLGALAAACAATVVLALALLGEEEDDSHAYASARLAPIAAGSNASGHRLGRGRAGRHARAPARARLARTMYELWCVRADGHWVSGGTFRPPATGGPKPC